MLYGHRIETTPILLDAYKGLQTLSHLTSSSLVMIALARKDYLAQVREKQGDFIKNRLVHSDPEGGMGRQPALPIPNGNPTLRTRPRPE